MALPPESGDPGRPGDEDAALSNDGGAERVHVSGAADEALRASIGSDAGLVVPDEVAGLERAEADARAQAARDVAELELPDDHRAAEAEQLADTIDEAGVELGPAGSRGRISTPPPPAWSVSAPSLMAVSVEGEPAAEASTSASTDAGPSTSAADAPDDDVEIFVSTRHAAPAPEAPEAAETAAPAAVEPPAAAASADEEVEAADEPEEELSLDELDGELEEDLDEEPAPPPMRARTETPPPMPRVAAVPPAVIPRRATTPPPMRAVAPPVPPAPPPRPRPVVVVPPLPSRPGPTPAPSMGSMPPADLRADADEDVDLAGLGDETPAPAPLLTSSSGIPLVDVSVDDDTIDSGPFAARLAASQAAARRASSAPPVAFEPPPEVPIESRLESPTALERALAALGDGDDRRAHWERRADALAELGERTTARPQQAELAYELGELCERHLADEARAVKAYGKALAADPSLRANLWAIRRVFYRRALWPNLVKLIDAEQRHARDHADRAELLTEKAIVQADRLGAADDARATLEEAVRLDPGAVPALLALERMAAAAGDEVAQVALWEQLAAQAALPARRLTYLLDQIDFWTTDRRDLPRAAELVNAAAALELDPDRVAAARLRVAEASGEPDALLAALEVQVGLAEARAGGAIEPGAADGAEGGPATERATRLRRRIVALRRRQAQVAQAAGQGERAWEYLQAASTLAAGEPIILADLADLAEELGRHGELAALLERWQAVEGDPRRSLTLGLRRADALLRGGAREQGLALLASLEASAPGLAPLAALRERDALSAAAAGDLEPLAAALARAADDARTGIDLGGGKPVAALPAAQAGYLAAATVWAHAVAGERGDAQARLALERALELAPRDPIAIEALVELHERAGRLADAATVLEDAAAHDKRALARLGRVYRAHGRLAEALAVDRRRWESEPGDLAVGWRIDATLAELGDDAARLAHLETLAERDRDPARRGYALVTAARLAESQGLGERAVELYRATLALWPDDGFARGALHAALRRLGRWPELAATLRGHAERTSSVDEARRALHEAAWVLEDRAGALADARAVYRQILDRAPDDVHARAGLARTGLATGEVGPALEALDAAAAAAGGDPVMAGPAAVALARASERVGDSGAALDAYVRAEQAAAPGTVAGTTAGLAAWQLAIARGDGAARIEATRALVRRTSDPRLVAALHEDLGWLFAFVNEDYDAAARAFVDSLAAAPDRPGPLLGAALVAARRQDAAALGAAYQRLAASVAMPEAAAALHLRGAAMATAAGDLDATAASIAAARAAAPDDVGALLAAAENVAVAVPPARGEEHALAGERLLARAEILALRSPLAHDPAARDGWELDRAEALEVAGRLQEAGVVVAGVLRSSPHDRRAHDALLRLARRGGDVVTQAAAAASLAGQSADLATRLALWGEAATIYDPAGHGRAAGAPGADVAAAVTVYRRMLVDDPGHAVFERLCAILREHQDARGLVEALTARLTWLESRGGDDPTIVPILFERAQVRRAAGDVRGAADDLDRVLERAPSHKEALRTQADLHTAIGDAPAAAALWRRYLAVESTGRARSDAELVLSKLLAEDLGDVGGAMEQLEHVIAAAPADLGHRERLVGLASHAQDWRRVTRELREIARLRGNPGERARDELRLGQTLRDRQGDAAEAIAAFERGRALDPINLELVRELAELLGTQQPARRTAALERAIEDLRAAIAGSPGVATLYDRLASVFGWRGDRDGQWCALTVVEALATPTAEQQGLLAAGRAAPPPPSSRQLLDADVRAALQAPGSGGALSELWRAASAAVNDCVGIDAGRLGFTRADRVAVKALGKRFEPAAAGLACLGVEDVEIYVSETRPGQARVLAASTPVLCLGADVASAASPMARFLLARACWQLADRTAALAELKDAEVVWYLVAALRASEVPVPAALAALCAGEDAAVAERTRLVGKHIARRDRKTIAGLAGRLGDAKDVSGWRRAVVASHARAGLAFAGDLHVALEAIDVGRGGRTLATDPIGLDLAVWTVSAAYLALRRRRGLTPGTSDGAPTPGGPR